MKAQYASYTRNETRIAKAATEVVRTVSRGIASAVCAVIPTNVRRIPSRLTSKLMKEPSRMRKNLMQNLAKEVGGETILNVFIPMRQGPLLASILAEREVTQAAW